MKAWALIAALALAACGEAADLDRLPAAGEARVTAVPSGGAVEIDGGETVRLAGLEAPRAGEPGAQASRRALERLVLGETVELLTGGAARDPFGRRVAQLRRARDRLWVQGRLLAEGQARVRTFADNRALAGRMLDREARARRAGRGLWAQGAYRVRLPSEVAAGARGFTIVEGRVTRVRRGYASTDLELGEPPHRLRVEIAARAEPDFTAAGKAPDSLAGRLVRVRGSLRGGALRVDHPEAVEVLKGG